MFRLLGKLFKLFIGFVVLIFIAGIILPTSSNKENTADTKRTGDNKTVSRESERACDRLQETIEVTEKTDDLSAYNTKADEKIVEKSSFATEVKQNEKETQNLKIQLPETEKGQESKEADFVEIKSGDRGDPVKDVQNILIALGFLSSVPDGVFGPKTEQAVIEYQKAVGIEPSGIIDNLTHSALIQDVETGMEEQSETKVNAQKLVLTSNNTTIKYASANVNVRSAPSAASEKLGVIAQGDPVQAGKEEEGWVPIIYEGSIGYVSSKYLSSSAPILKLTTETSTANLESTTKTVNEQEVWIPTNGGTKFHSKSSCSNMKNPQKVTRSEAEAMGFTPCGRCNP